MRVHLESTTPFSLTFCCFILPIWKCVLAAAVILTWVLECGISVCVHVRVLIQSSSLSIDFSYCMNYVIQTQGIKTTTAGVFMQVHPCCFSDGSPNYLKAENLLLPNIAMNWNKGTCLTTEVFVVQFLHGHKRLPIWT